MSESNVRKLAGETAFRAYNAAGPNPWKTFDGRDVPQWHEVTEDVRTKWIAAAEKVLAMAGMTLSEASNG